MKLRRLCWIGLVTALLAGVWAAKEPDPQPAEPSRFHRLACQDAVHCVAFSPDGRTLATGCGVSSETGEIKLWDLDNLQRPWALSGHQSWIVALAFGPDSRSLGTASFDTVRRWDLVRQQPAGTQREDFGPSRCGCLAFRPDLQQLAVAALYPSGPTLQLRTIPASAASRVLDCPESIAALAFSADGRLLAAAGVRDGVRLFDTATGSPCPTLPVEGSVSALAFAPDGKSLAVGNSYGRVQIWNVTGVQLRARWIADRHPIYSLAFSPDGHLLATGSNGGSVKLWDAGAGTPLAGHQEHTDAVAAVAFSPDGQWLASASFDTTVGLWRHGK
jgi:WD40 repeat protein